MCRNIKILFNFDPPATHDEIENASVQFVRKISGFHHPAKVNEKAYTLAVARITQSVQDLLSSLSTDAQPRNRAIEKERAHARAVKRFGTK